MERDVQLGQLIAGKYRVEQVLGRGGMGVVMAALHEQLNQRVALKFLTDSAYQQPEAVARFQREARAAVQIQSEHVARVMDVGTLDTGSPYMVMEYLRGRDLKDVSTRRGPLPITEAVDYVLQACDAVAEAHSLGIVHRDLKPSNLFLTERPDGTALVKVLDFGISKALHAGETSQLQMTASAAIMGSPQYMSPEQIRSSKNVDARADVWALGTILHELLTGSPAYVADTVPGLLAMIVADAPPPLSASRPDAPADLEASILRCLQKDREQRFSNVAEFARSLERHASSEARPLVRRIARVLGVDVPAALPTAPALPYGVTLSEPVAQTNGTWARTGKVRESAAVGRLPALRRPEVQVGAAASVLALGLVAWFMVARANGAAENEAYDPAPLTPMSAPVVSAAAVAPMVPSLPPVAPTVAPAVALTAPPTAAAAAEPSAGRVHPLAEGQRDELRAKADESARDPARDVGSNQDRDSADSKGKRVTAMLGRTPHSARTPVAKAPRNNRTESAAAPASPTQATPKAPPPAAPKKADTLDLFNDTK